MRVAVTILQTGTSGTALIRKPFLLGHPEHVPEHDRHMGLSVPDLDSRQGEVRNAEAIDAQGFSADVPTFRIRSATSREYVAKEAL